MCSHRKRIREAFICLCMLSSVFSITAVAVSVFYVEHVDKVVSAREWLTFDRYFFEEMVEWPVLLSLITLLIALSLGPLSSSSSFPPPPSPAVCWPAGVSSSS